MKPAGRTATALSRPASCPPPPSRPLRTGARLWIFRIAALLLPLGALFLIESALRLFGYGYPTAYFLKTRDGQTLSANPAYTRQFFGKKTAARPDIFRISPVKKAGSIRVFVLGESAAMGTPDPAFSFSRVLEVMLRQQYPGVEFEMVNCAMRGINSHIMRPIALECARQQPDLFIVYAGNNEMIGLHSPDPGCSRWALDLRLIRATQVLKSTRLAQAMQNLLLSRFSKPPEKQDADFFRRQRLAADDWRRQTVYDNFTANVQDVCNAAARAGAPTLLCTVGVNLRDCPPLGALHRAGLTPAATAAWDDAYNRGVQAATTGRHADAVAHFRTAAGIDDHFADLHFRWAVSCEALGEVAAAREHYRLACDWDALQFRTDSKMNGAIRRLGEQFRDRGVKMIDVEAAFAASELSENGLPGNKLFHEHVHPRFAGDYLLARTVVPAVVSVLGTKLPAGGGPAKALPTIEECADVLAFTPLDELNVEAAMVSLTGRPPLTERLDNATRQVAAERALQARREKMTTAELEGCLQTHRVAAERRPNDWKLQHNLGMIQQQLGHTAAAAPSFERLVSNFPEVAPFRVLLGTALIRIGKTESGRRHLEEALRLDPTEDAARQLLTQLGIRPAR